MWARFQAWFDLFWSTMHRLDEHAHSVALCYPTGGPGVTVQKNAVAWTVGGTSVLIPANTIATRFDIHGLQIEAVPDNGTYELRLYKTSVSQANLVARLRFTRNNAQEITSEVPCQTTVIPANTEIVGTLQGSNGNATTVTLSLRYHVY